MVTKTAFATVLVVGAFLGTAPQVMAQTNVGVTNDRTDHGSWDDNPKYGSANQWQNCDWFTNTSEVNNWWGKDTSNNVITHLNTSNGGTVRVTDLDTDSFSSTGTYYTRNSSDTGWDGPYYTTHSHTPRYLTKAYIYNDVVGTNAVNVTAGRTTHLNVSIDPATTTGYMSGHYTIGTLDKVGAGRLSLEINKLEIANFTGNNGTLNVGNDPAAEGVLDVGTLDSTTVKLYGGLGSGGSISNGGNSTHYTGLNPTTGVGANVVSNFSFTSGGATGPTTAANWWHIVNPLESTGFNNMGYMTVNGTSTANILNGTTNIGMRFEDNFQVYQDGLMNWHGNGPKAGYLTLLGAADVGTTSGTHYLNINSGAMTVAGLFRAGTNGSANGVINHMWGQTLTTSAGTSLAQLAGSTFTANISNSTWGNTGYYYVGESGTGTLNIFSGSNGVYTGAAGNRGVLNSGVGNFIVGVNAGSVGAVNVFGDDSQINRSGDGNSFIADAGKGDMYLWDGSKFNEAAGMTIANQVDSLGRVYVDGYGTSDAYRTTMNVTGALVVGQKGQAGGTYTEVRSSNRYKNDSANWFADPQRTADLVNATNAAAGLTTGNDPGLAITRGGLVHSGSGQIGVEDNGGAHATDPITGSTIAGTPAAAGVWSNGYVVIDNKLNLSVARQFNANGAVYVPLDNVRPFSSGSNGFLPISTQYGATTSTWLVDGKLDIGVNGNAFARVINGGSLVTGANGTTVDSTYVDAGTGRGQLFVNGNDTTNGRSFFKSYGSTVVGNGNLGRGTLRIYDGALGETGGLYIGTVAGSEGEVFVDDPASTLRIMANTNSSFYHGKGLADADRMKGSGLFGASHNALVWLDANAVVRMNGDAEIATNAVLHLDNAYKNPVPTPPVDPFGGIDVTRNPLFDVGTGRMTVTNARVEGIGLITGENGVHFRQSDGPWDSGQAEIDPGLVYGWQTRCEKDFYGDLSFGHTLNMTGNVKTYFDVNAGYYDFGAGTGNNNKKQDHIYVVGDPLNTTDQVKATLSGELMIHARLSDYYEDTLEYDVVTVESANNLTGSIDRMYDTLTIKPSRFFDGAHQEIRQDDVNGDGLLDDILYVSMTLNENPFEDAAHTYNETSLGQALDSIYALRDQRWLPFLRNFWYLEDPDFLDAYKLYSGEIRAHSMLMALQNPWTYVNERNGFNRCNGHAFFGPQNRSCNIVGCRGLWGSYIYTDNSTDSDGNAGDYTLRRNGFMAGYERASKGGRAYLGALFAYNQGKLNAYRSNAKSDDFQFGLYHGVNICDVWEWKNYLGMGIQNYHTTRNIDMNLSHSAWNGSAFVCSDQPINGNLMSDFAGLSFAGSTELARPFYFGECCQWTVRPYMALDMMAVWQNRASEYADFDDTYRINNTDYRASDLVALDFHSSTNVRVYGRPGIMVERGGSNGNLRAGVSYSYLMGGRRYTNVDNQFQFGGDKFNIRGVDDGSGFITANVGAAAYLGKCKQSMVFIDYAVLAGSHSTTHAAQLGLQKNF